MLGPSYVSRVVLRPSAVLAVLLFSMKPRQAHAQVNVEVLRKQLTEQGVHGKLAGSITTYAGNTTGTELGGSALVGLRQGPELVYFSTNANYSNLGGDVQVANAFAHFR